MKILFSLLSIVLITKECESAKTNATDVDFKDSKQTCADDTTNGKNHVPTDMLFFDDKAGGIIRFSSTEWEGQINDVVHKDWLFAGAAICVLEFLHVDYAKRLVEFNLKCQCQEKKYVEFCKTQDE